MKATAAVLAAAVIVSATARAADEPAPVRVDHIDGGAAVMVDVGRVGQVKQWLADNKGKLALAILGVIAVDRAAYNNDWLWYHDRASKTSGDVNVNEEAAAPQQTSTGSQSVNVYVSNSENTTISIRREEP